MAASGNSLEGDGAAGGASDVGQAFKRKSGCKPSQQRCCRPAGRSPQVRKTCSRLPRDLCCGTRAHNSVIRTQIVLAIPLRGTGVQVRLTLFRFCSMGFRSSIGLLGRCLMRYQSALFADCSCIITLCQKDLCLTDYVIPAAYSVGGSTVVYQVEALLGIERKSGV